MSDRFTFGWGGKRHKGIRIGTLWYSQNREEADVTMSANFDGLSDVTKIDMLVDVIGLLERERDLLLTRYPAHVRGALNWPEPTSG